MLIGSKTSKSRWVDYEIQKSISKKNGLLGVYIYNLKDSKVNSSSKGEDPKYLPKNNFFATFLATIIDRYPCCSYYDWDDKCGYQKLGDWIKKAAKQADR